MTLRGTASRKGVVGVVVKRRRGGKQPGHGGGRIVWKGMATPLAVVLASSEGRRMVGRSEGVAESRTGGWRAVEAGIWNKMHSP